MPTGGRYGPQGGLGAPFSHIQQSHLPHHGNQHHHPPGSAGIAPPAFSSFQPFPHPNQPTGMNSFNGVNNTNGIGNFGGGAALGLARAGLGSEAAMAGFAHGAAMEQRRDNRDAMRRISGGIKNQSKGRIRDVWQSNLAQEMQNLRELVEQYPYISMVCHVAQPSAMP